jgi:hypothetical protein
MTGFGANITGAVGRVLAGNFAPVGDGAGSVNSRQAQRASFDRHAAERRKKLGTDKINLDARLVPPKKGAR